MRIRPVDLVDVLAYLVVLGIFVELFPEVITESFLMSVLTAVLLKLVLEVVLRAKKAAVTRIRSADSRATQAVNAGMLALLLPGSKFVMIELVALVFGDSVYLGGFFQVTALIIALTLAQAGLRLLVEKD
ncbi:hypothetical protein [Demequina sp. NBRC 110054]|uniref:hypothetical protein n=1 Tax=Demequina sp. NBRC 110054 TaxID=1570343 RepID=UPI000A076149|nr:hypothetical protein [Demequina sp. NBRC 110054]